MTGRDRRGEGQCFAWCVTHGERAGWGWGREKQIMNPADPEEKRGSGGSGVQRASRLSPLADVEVGKYALHLISSVTPRAPLRQTGRLFHGCGHYQAHRRTHTTHPMHVDVHSHCKAKGSRARGARIYRRVGRKSFACAHPNACSLDMGIRESSLKVTESVSVWAKLYGHQSQSSGLGILILSL